MRKITGVLGLCLVSAIALLVYGCGGGSAYGGGGGTTGSTSGIITTLIVSPSTASVTVSGMQTFKVVTKDASGTVVTGTPVVWNSSDPSVATIDANGVATGVAVGTASISASVTYNSGGAYTTGNGTTYTSNMATLTVSTMNQVMGVAATGRALIGAVVTLKDSSGKSQTAMTDAQGRFQLSVAGMHAPFLVRADDGRGHRLFGAAASEGVANVDTVTDLMLRAWYVSRGTTPEQAFGAMTAHPTPDAKALQALDHAFSGILHDSLAAVHLDPDKFDLFSTPFAADSTGFDALLDHTRVATASTLRLQDGLMGRTTEIGASAEGLDLTTHGASSPDVSMRRVDLP
ncbi:MAG TPA: Ig-like domain-containing protein [Gammaproteobacteria bacterium]|nr:Ig-like domain-containing protein [Gammaproteobacteria bacterium]